jgi:hypothetical protein
MSESPGSPGLGGLIIFKSIITITYRFKLTKESIYDVAVGKLTNW